MKTAVQAVFSELEELHPNLFNIYTTEGKEFVHHFHKYIAMEKEQIIETWHNGYNNQSPMIDEENCGQEYYNETFKSE